MCLSLRHGEPIAHETANGLRRIERRRDQQRGNKRRRKVAQPETTEGGDA